MQIENKWIPILFNKWIIVSSVQFRNIINFLNVENIIVLFVSYTVTNVHIGLYLYTLCSFRMQINYDYLLNPLASLWGPLFPF